MTADMTRVGLYLLSLYLEELLDTMGTELLIEITITKFGELCQPLFLLKLPLHQSGSLLVRYQRIVNLVSGIIVIVFGLNYLGLFRWNLFHGGSRVLDAQDMTFFSAALFGIIFSLGWTPCVGAFLGSALALATQQGHVLEGTLMLLAYSLGLGIPFLLSAVLIDALKGAFDWVKRHYQIINLLSGGFLILIGILMASGMLGRLLRQLA